MTSLVLTVLGNDRPGLVSAVSSVVEAQGGSWQRSALSRLAGQFAGVVLVSVPAANVAALQLGLAALAADGLQITVTDGADAAGPRRTWTVHLVGQDRLGIVAEVSAALARQGVSIEEMQTDVRDAPMSGGTLFEATLAMSVPDDIEQGTVRAELERLGDELMVDIDMVAPAV